MRHLDHRTLVDRGRKAGLGTADLYQAIASRPPEGDGRARGTADGNGFVASYDAAVRRVVYRPSADLRG